MKLNYGKKYSKLLKEYSEEIIFFLCEGLKAGEITEQLHNDFNVTIPFQAITWFYQNNQKYFDECIKNRKNEKKEKLKEKFCLEWAKEQAYFDLSCLTLTPSDLKALPAEKKLKYRISLMNALAKMEGQDKSEININNTAFEDFFDEDIIQDALDDYYESTDEGSD